MKIQAQDNMIFQKKKIPVAVIKQDINPNATVLSRIPLKKVPGP